MTKSNSLICIIVVCSVLSHKSDGLLEWLFGDDDKPVSAGDGSEENTIRFEVLSTDEKFLDFAQTLTDLSPLDACYNVVIYNLKKRCGDMTEEDLGKLSVQLLNCQSEAEDRPVFRCTNSMTLADCTKEMDGTTWNSYQIVGNRARAMCYATQQTQFRRLTELTVNNLVGAATDQLKSLEVLKNGQDQLHSLTSDTVRKLYESQQDLLLTQTSLKKVHEDIFGLVSSNVKEIMQEKALIAAGNKELATLTEDIKEKLDSTSQRIEQRERIEHTKHERILKDLREIQENTEQSVRKFDASLSNLLSKFGELEGQYSDLSVNLGRMNTTMTFVMGAVEALKSQIDDRVDWITQILGGTDMKLKTVSCCLLHLAYFFLLVMTATFLQVALATRLAMMVVIVGNVAAELNNNYSMDFAGLTVFMAAGYLGFWSLVWMKEKFGVKLGSRISNVVSVNSWSSSNARSRQTASLSRDEYDTLLDLITKLSASVNERTQSPMTNGSAVHETSFRPATPPSGLRHNYREDTPDISPVEEDSILRRNLLNIGRVSRGSSRSSSRAGTPLGNDSNSSFTSVSRCSASTISGARCRLPAAGGSEQCRRHMTLR